MGLYNSVHPVSNTAGGAAGSGNAASVDAELRTTVEVYYNVSATSDDIKIEGKTDDGSWRELEETVASGSVVTGGTSVTVDTGYRHVRAYAGSGFSDSDVNDIEVAAKGL